MSRDRAPRAGELTPGWRIVTACLWIAVVAAFAAIWNTSERLGLSTWWLGPRGDPNPIYLRLSPFVAPALMVLAAANNLRRLPVLGIGASLLTAVVGIVDLWYVRGLAILEIVVGAVALAISAASFTGLYRRDPDLADPPAG
jgi:hypothetical protein